MLYYIGNEVLTLHFQQYIVWHASTDEPQSIQEHQEASEGPDQEGDRLAMIEERACDLGVCCPPVEPNPS